MIHTTVLNPESPQPALTFIHGWAAESSVWLPFAEAFCADYQVHLLDLPGFGQSPALSLDTKNGEQIAQQWIEAILPVLPEQTHLVGWSLGGLISQRLAAQVPQRILSLTNMASTPKFIQTENWRFAVSPSLMKDFIQAVGIESAIVLKQFWRLQFQGSDEARKWMKSFQAQIKHRKPPTLTGLLQGLYILKDLDNRALFKISENLPKSPVLPAQMPPVGWIFGEKDPLIPLQLTEAFIPNQPVEVIRGAAHMPFFSHAQETEKALRALLNSYTISAF